MKLIDPSTLKTDRDIAEGLKRNDFGIKSEALYAILEESPGPMTVTMIRFLAQKRFDWNPKSPEINQIYTNKHILKHEDGPTMTFTLDEKFKEERRNYRKALNMPAIQETSGHSHQLSPKDPEVMVRITSTDPLEMQDDYNRQQKFTTLLDALRNIPAKKRNQYITMACAILEVE